MHKRRARARAAQEAAEDGDGDKRDSAQEYFTPQAGSGVDVDDSKWQQSEWQRKEREKARQNVRFGGGANGNFRRQP